MSPLMRRKHWAMVTGHGRSPLGVEGAAAVELAITVSLLAVLVLGVSDYGALMGTSASLQGATRAGAEYAKVDATDTTGIMTQVCGHLGLTLTSGSCSPVTPGAVQACTCVDDTWPKAAVCPPPLTGINPCSTVKNPYTGLTDTRVLQYVEVTATQSFSPMATVKKFGLLPSTTFGFPSTLTGTTVARTQ
jgi:Flp pilus assembly protein TadG